MANTRSAIKRVRQNARRARINSPRRSAAKTYVARALKIATGGAQGDPAVVLAEAMAALDRAASSGAIHPNAAARRKSRLARKLNAALGGLAIESMAAKVRTTGKAAAAKAARARVAASRARAEAGPKTAAGKARVALAKKTVSETKAPTSEAAPAGKAATGSAAAVGKAAPARKAATAAKAATEAKTPARAAKTPARRTAKAEAPATGTDSGAAAKPRTTRSRTKGGDAGA